MQVGKWGNSLAVRIPAQIVEALKLKEGDEIEVELAGDRAFKISRDTAREAALSRLSSLGWKVPPDYKFDRDEANERGV